MRRGAVAIVAIALAILGGVAAAAPAAADVEAGLEKPEPDLHPTTHPVPVGDLGALALRDGVWHVGEIALYRGVDYDPSIFDTSPQNHDDYRNYYFVNSNTVLNDNVSSLRNGHRQVGVALYEDILFEGPWIEALQYPRCPGVLCFGYVRLGWANNELSSHHPHVRP